MRGFFNPKIERRDTMGRWMKHARKAIGMGLNWFGKENVNFKAITPGGGGFGPTKPLVG